MVPVTSIRRVRDGVAMAVVAAMLAGCATVPSHAGNIDGVTTAPVAAPLVSPNADSPAARAWGLTDSDIAADPAVRYGVLPNGMRYALRANATPKDSAIIRMRIDMGSFGEAEDQRGLAHFLEHMAFNGSTNVPEGEMIKLLQRNGLAFGADTNAYTSFDETVYKLDLPRTTPDLIGTGLMLMRETAGNLTLDPAAIDRERGVILSERRARDTFQLKAARDELAFTAPGTLIANRLPIGDPEVLRSAPPQRIRDFYDAYYRPERTTLVMVGDFDLDAVEQQIRARFTDFTGRGAAGPDPDIGRIDFARPTAASIFVDPAMPDLVTLSWQAPYRDEPDVAAIRARDTLRGLGTAILNRRLDRLSKSSQPPFAQAVFFTGDEFEVRRTMSALAVTSAEGRALAMSRLEQEVRRAREHGFTEAELREAIVEQRNQLATAAASADTRRSQNLADALIGSASTGRVITTPQSAIERFDATVAGLTADRVGAVWRDQWADAGQPLVRVTAKAPVPGGEAAILAQLRQSMAVAVTPPAAAQVAKFAYTDFGTPGAVVSDTVVADLGIRRVRFANNVMLNIKRTDFQKNRVSMAVRVDGGKLLATRDDPSRVDLAGQLTQGGLDAHSADELTSILAGRTVTPGLTAGPDGFGTTVTTTPEDFLLQAQVSAAFLTAPGYRPEAVSQLRQIAPTIYAMMDASPEAVINRDAGGIVRDNDPRFVLTPLDRLMALDWPAFRAATRDVLATGAIEIGVVGDMDEAAVIDAIARTYGALPTRAAAFDPRTEARRINFARDLSTRTLIHKGDADQAAVRSVWRATDDRDPVVANRLYLLGEVMQIELTDELRERLGQTYSPGVGVDLSSIYPGFGTLVAQSNVDFKDIAAAEAAIDVVVRRLRDQPVSADIIDRARRPALEALQKARRENGYWLRNVARATSEADRLDRVRRAEALLTGVTAADLQAAARTYLADDRRLRFRAVSDKAGK